MELELDLLINTLEDSKTVTPQCCDNKNILIDDNNIICINCGAVEYQYILKHPEYDYLNKRQLYKRKSYFREKFKLLNGLKLCNSPKYDILINKLKQDNLIKNTIIFLEDKQDEYIKNYFILTDHIYKLKGIIGKLGYSKLYKYTYQIIYDLYKFRCFKIPVRYLDLLTIEWLNFEQIYNKIYKHRKNMISYNVIIKLFLDKYKIIYNELLILPRNKMKIYNKLKKLNYFNL